MTSKLLALTLVFVALPAAANTPIFPDNDFSGAYLIEALPVDGATHAAPQCVVQDNARAPYGVRLVRWGGTGLCGIGDVAANLDAKLTVWDVATIKHSDGRKAYTIRSRANGECLIRGHSAKDLQPTTNLWGASNATCGFATADAAIDNGQATWLFDEASTAGGSLITALRTTKGPAYVSFASMGGNLITGSALLTVDHGLRFVRIPESCTASFQLEPGVIRVCGVGDFAQPVRVEVADYLGVTYAPWNATNGFDMGDISKHYAAVTPAVAPMYCNRLRSGGFNDWRVPTMAELQALYDAFPNNQLRTKFDWSTGYRPHQTSDAGRGLILHSGTENSVSNNPFPVACVR